MRRFLFPCATALVLATAAGRAASPAPAKLSFNTHIQPILAENCYACHGIDGSSRKAELRLDRWEFATAKRKDGDPAIIPGKPEESPLVERIESKDEKKIMPPPEGHKTLKPEDIATLRRWIAEGAAYEEHWSFIPPRRPAVPAVAQAQAKAVRNPIDAFVVARLAKDGLTPSAEADRRTLIRRVTLDLTGIVPAP
jgi:mono/diheme cytochrome c family protein